MRFLCRYVTMKIIMPIITTAYLCSLWCWPENTFHVQVIANPFFLLQIFSFSWILYSYIVYIILSGSTLNIIILRFICVVACVDNSVFIIDDNQYSVCIRIIIFIHFSADSHLEHVRDLLFIDIICAFMHKYLHKHVLTCLLVKHRGRVRACVEFDIWIPT